MGLVAAALVVVAVGARALGPDRDEPPPGELRVEEATATPSPSRSPRPSPSPRPRPSPRPTPAELPGTWTAGAPSPVPARYGGAVAWTGREVLVVGGSIDAGDGTAVDLALEGAAYDPAADTWRVLPPPPLEPRRTPAWAWTGEELVIWGGVGRLGVLNDGAAYDPAVDTWRALAPSPLSPRGGARGVWTGTELLVLGGGDLAAGLADGAAYDPATDRWRPLPPAPVPLGFPVVFGIGGEPTATWTGRAAVTVPPISYVGPGEERVRVLALDPAGGAWSELPEVEGSQLLAIVGEGDDLTAVVVDYSGSGPRPRAHRLAGGAAAWEPEDGPTDALESTATAYDPGARRLWLAGSRPATTGVLVYDLTGGTWSRTTARPGPGAAPDPAVGTVGAVWAGTELVVLENTASGALQVNRWRPAP